MVNFNVTSTRGCSKINFSNKMHELIEPLTSSAGSTISMRLSLNTGGGAFDGTGHFSRCTLFLLKISQLYHRTAPPVKTFLPCMFYLAKIDAKNETF